MNMQELYNDVFCDPYTGVLLDSFAVGKWYVAHRLITNQVTGSYIQTATGGFDTSEEAVANALLIKHLNPVVFQVKEPK